jgi:hypothetical protein
MVWIVKENLKKNRLVKNFAADVEATRTSLKQGVKNG